MRAEHLPAARVPSGAAEQPPYHTPEPTDAGGGGVGVGRRFFQGFCDARVVVPLGGSLDRLSCLLRRSERRLGSFGCHVPVVVQHRSPHIRHALPEMVARTRPPRICHARQPRRRSIEPRDENRRIAGRHRYDEDAKVDPPSASRTSATTGAVTGGRAVSAPPLTRYADSGDVNIAFQVTGNRQPIDLDREGSVSPRRSDRHAG